MLSYEERVRRSQQLVLRRSNSNASKDINVSAREGNAFDDRDLTDNANENDAPFSVVSSPCRHSSASSRLLQSSNTTAAAAPQQIGLFRELLAETRITKSENSSRGVVTCRRRQGCTDTGEWLWIDKANQLNHVVTRILVGDTHSRLHHIKLLLQTCGGSCGRGASTTETTKWNLARFFQALLFRIPTPVQPQQQPIVRSLALIGVVMTPRLAALMAEVLSSNTTRLEFLQICSLPTHESLIALCRDGLERNTSLRELRLTYSGDDELGGYSGTRSEDESDAIVQLFLALQKQQGLQILKLCSFPIGGSTLRRRLHHVSNFLLHSNSTLQELTLNQCQLTDADVPCLVQAVVKSNHLCLLDLSMNQITNLDLFVNLIQVSSSLTSLSLSQNAMYGLCSNNDAGSMFCHALAKTNNSHHLERLYLDVNPLTAAFTRQLQHTLKESNVSLKRLGFLSTAVSATETATTTPAAAAVDNGVTAANISQHDSYHQQQQPIAFYTHQIRYMVALNEAGRGLFRGCLQGGSTTNTTNTTASKAIDCTDYKDCNTNQNSNSSSINSCKMTGFLDTRLLVPRVLARIAREPHLIYGLLREHPHFWLVQQHARS